MSYSKHVHVCVCETKVERGLVGVYVHVDGRREIRRIAAMTRTQ